jgi:hypothetical protein
MASRHSVGILIAALAVAGCSVQRSNHAERAQSDLVGLSKAELFRCAGLPDKQEKVGNDEFLTYNNDLLTSGGLTIPIIGGGVNFFDSKYCHATFVLRNGRAQALHYAGNASSPLAQLDQCGYIVDTCIEHLDRVRAAAGRPVGAAELDSTASADAPAGSPAVATTAEPDNRAGAEPAERRTSGAAKPRRDRARPSPGR